MRTVQRCGWWVLALALTISPAACRRPGEHVDGDRSKAVDEGGFRATESDPLVNPPSLLKPAPADRSLIATDETLYCFLDGNPGTLNPIFESSAVEQRLSEILFDRPFVFDARMQWTIAEHIVDSYQEEADHRSAILRLKPGLTWHDGAPFTARDIAYSWEQIVDPNVQAPSAKSGTDQIEQCIALDELTVKFIHKTPLPTNRWNIMFPVAPRHILEKGKQDDPTLKESDYYVQFGRGPVGNGPYRFVEWLEDDRIVLERWEDYPGPKPYFRRVVYRIVPDKTQALLAFEKQRIDEVSLTPQQFLVDTQKESFTKVGVKAFGQQWKYYYIGWNQDGTNPFFADKAVRVAMCHAVDYDRILETIFMGLYARCYGSFHPDSLGCDPEIQPYDYDPARAAELLDQAGWITDPDDGWRYKEIVSGEGNAVRTKFEFFFNLPRESATAPKYAAIIQEDLRKLGVEMKTRIFDWKTFLQLAYKHEFQAQASAWNAGTDPDTGWNLWRTESYENGRNYGGYSNPRVDELFALGRGEFDETKRMQYYAEASRLIYEDAPYTFLCYAPVLWGFNQRISGVQFSPRGVTNFNPAELAWWVPRDRAFHDSVPP